MQRVAVARVVARMARLARHLGERLRVARREGGAVDDRRHQRAVGLVGGSVSTLHAHGLGAGRLGHGIHR